MAKKETAKPIQLPQHPVDALIALADAGIIPPLDPGYIAQARALCDEAVPLAEIGRIGGSKSTPAKRRAVRANGKKGGRPRGSKDSYPRTRGTGKE